jgi:hypothetical protein
MESRVLRAPDATGVLNWLVRSSTKKVDANESIATVEGEDGSVTNICSPWKGAFKRRLVESGARVGPEEAIAEIMVCVHPAFFKDKCVSCGVRDPALLSQSHNETDGSLPKSNVILTAGNEIRLSEAEALHRKGASLELLYCTNLTNLH